jgi:hypothetical protein
LQAHLSKEIHFRLGHHCGAGLSQNSGDIKMSNLQIIRRFKFSQFDTGWAVVDDDGEVQAFFDDVEGAPDAALTAAQDWVQSCN